MKEKVNFSDLELTFLVTNAMIFKIFSLYPTIIEEFAATALWVVCLGALVLGFVMFLIIGWLQKPFGRASFAEIVEGTFGKFGAAVVGVVLLAFCILQISVYLRHTVDSLKVATFYNSNIAFLAMFFVLPAILGAIRGVRPIVRLASIIVPVVIVCDLVMCFGAGSKFEVANLFPIMGKGVSNTIWIAVKNVAYFADIFILLMLAPYAESERSFRRVSRRAVLLGGGILVLIVTSYQLVASYPTSLFHSNPMQLMQNVSQYDVNFIRMGAGFIIFWAASFMIYIASTIWMVGEYFRRVAKTKGAGPLVWCMGAAVFLSTVYMPNILSQALVFEYVLAATAIILIAIPVFILCCGRIKKKFSG